MKHPVCAKIKPSDHVCHLYSSHEEHANLVANFCLDGLKEDNGKVMCLFADEHLLSSLRHVQTGSTQLHTYQTLRQQEVEQALRAADLDVDAAVTAGKLIFHSSPSLYMHNDKFSANKMFENLMRVLDASEPSLDNNTRTPTPTTAKPNVRLWCDALFYANAYLDPMEGAGQFFDYEHKLSHLHNSIPGSSVLCCYDRRLFSAPFLQRVFAAHPVISVGTKTFKNHVYYIREDFMDYFGSSSITPFSELHQSKPALDNWISHLERHREQYQKRDKKRKKPDLQPQAAGHISSFISNMR